MTSAIRFTLIPVVFCSSLFGCAGKQTTHLADTRHSIRIKGSDTMVFLVQRWAEAFMKTHAGIAVYSEGGGSATGIRALINGTTDICATSRPWQPEEVKELVEKQGSLGISILSAKDALSIYLHPENPLQNLTLDQIKDIFTSRVANWQSLGGHDEQIVVLNRNPNSGTYLFFEEHLLLGETYSSSAKTLPTTLSIVQAIAKNRAAIGYGGFAYGDSVQHASVNGIAPTPENVRNGKYPISRYLYLYTVSQPHGIMKQFIDWVLSPEGQRVVQEVGYIPLYEVKRGQ
jgi:phosphate transport system substrate-binding protein